MQTNSDKITPILPFDITYGESFTIYRKMTYVRDRDLCGLTTTQMESGNVYKYYTITETEPILIGERKEPPSSDEQ